MFLSAEDQILNSCKAWSTAHMTPLFWQQTMKIQISRSDCSKQLGPWLLVILCLFSSLEKRVPSFSADDVDHPQQSTELEHRQCLISSLKPPTLASISGRISLVRSICNSDHPYADLCCLVC